MILIGLPVGLATDKYFLYMSNYRISCGVQEHYNGASASTTWLYLIFWEQLQKEILSWVDLSGLAIINSLN